MVKCDARTSFWGDSVAVTVHREPGLVASGTDGVYIGTGYSSILGVSSIVPSVNLIFQVALCVEDMEQTLENCPPRYRPASGRGNPQRRPVPHGSVAHDASAP